VHHPGNKLTYRSGVLSLPDNHPVCLRPLLYPDNKSYISVVDFFIWSWAV
jgi:hypothetical protein